jgi:TPR repeat protein
LAIEGQKLSPDGRKHVPRHVSREVAEAVATLSHKTKKLEEAKRGNLEAQLQQYYSLVIRAPADAHQWLCKSADQGHPDARYRLALLYEYGNEGFERDYIRAYLWYVLAAETGSYWAGRHLQRLARDHLSPDDTVEAKKALREWKPGQCEVDLGLVPEQ